MSATRRPWRENLRVTAVSFPQARNQRVTRICRVWYTEPNPTINTWPVSRDPLQQNAVLVSQTVCMLEIANGMLQVCAVLITLYGQKC